MTPRAFAALVGKLRAAQRLAVTLPDYDTSAEAEAAETYGRLVDAALAEIARTPGGAHGLLEVPDDLGSK